MKYRTARLAAALAVATCCMAEVAAAAAPAPPAEKGPTGPSNYIKCDGMPNNVTAGETAARLVGAVTLLGLFAPPAEQANPKQRLFGEEGIAACEALLVKTGAGEGNLNRRMRLHLARALHRIEAKTYQAAIADVATFQTEYAERSATPEYRLGTGLAVTYVEALALAAKGDHDAAADKALEMSEAAPYDQLAGLKTSALLSAAGRYGPRVKAFYDRLV
jgi:hypothetical protein